LEGTDGQPHLGALGQRQGLLWLQNAVFLGGLHGNGHGSLSRKNVGSSGGTVPDNKKTRKPEGYLARRRPARVRWHNLDAWPCHSLDERTKGVMAQNPTGPAWPSGRVIHDRNEGSTRLTQLRGLCRRPESDSGRFPQLHRFWTRIPIFLVFSRQSKFRGTGN
jgi:hypothetical protein